ncbi:hypothetical protein ACHAWF_010291 [Thalassiosira exigua]
MDEFASNGEGEGEGSNDTPPDQLSPEPPRWRFVNAAKKIAGYSAEMSSAEVAFKCINEDDLGGEHHLMGPNKASESMLGPENAHDQIPPEQTSPADTTFNDDDSVSSNSAATDPVRVFDVKPAFEETPTLAEQETEVDTRKGNEQSHAANDKTVELSSGWSGHFTTASRDEVIDEARGADAVDAALKEPEMKKAQEDTGKKLAMDKEEAERRRAEFEALVASSNEGSSEEDEEEEFDVVQTHSEEKQAASEEVKPHPEAAVEKAGPIDDPLDQMEKQLEEVAIDPESPSVQEPNTGNVPNGEPSKEQEKTFQERLQERFPNKKKIILFMVLAFVILVGAIVGAVLAANKRPTVVTGRLEGDDCVPNNCHSWQCSNGDCCCAEGLTCVGSRSVGPTCRK